MKTEKIIDRKDILKAMKVSAADNKYQCNLLSTMDNSAGKRWKLHSRK